MASIVFIGDELSAAGFRLTGIEALAPQAEAVGDTLSAARTRAELVIITADCARQISAEELEAALLTEAPIVAIIPDVRQRVPPPDVARRLRAVLGIER